MTEQIQKRHTAFPDNYYHTAKKDIKFYVQFPEIVHIPISWLAGVGGSSSNDATNKHCSVNNALIYYLVNQFSLHYHQSYHSLHMQQQSAINLVDVKKSDFV